MIALLRRDLTGLSDPLLVERVKESDDPRAFDEIVRRHKQRIFGYVCRMTHDGPDAEDLTQEVFIRAYQSLHRFRADAAVDTWLSRIATNLVIDRFRRNQRAPQAWVPLDAEDEALGALPATDRDSDPEATAQLGELRREVRKAVETLPPKLRGAVVLHDIEGLSYEEVAEALGCPVGTVKSRLFNGRSLLRRKLAYYVDPAKRACGQTARGLGEYLDGTLPLRSRRAIEAHLLACAACRRERETLRRTLALVTSLPRRELSADFDTTLQARLAAARPGGRGASRSPWRQFARPLIDTVCGERYLRAPWPSPLRRLAPAGVVTAVALVLAARTLQPPLVAPPAPRTAPAYVTALVHEHQLLSAGADMNDTVVRHNLDSDLLGDGDE